MKFSGLLSPFGWIYGAAADVRVKLYEKGVFKSSDLGVPVVSVGNITVGGTGKTPLVAFVAQVLAERGEKVCILTRGYKRENERERVLVSDGERILAGARKSGDEPFELARKLLGKAAVVADANRAGAGKWAKENLSATVLILDDAFQHLKLKRNLDIVCVDATTPFGNEKTLPAGILREPLKNLSRADAFVITRANLADETEVEKIKNNISKYNRDAKIFISKNKILSLSELKDFLSKKETTNPFTIYHSPFTIYSPFCALGNPVNFFEQLRSENYKIVSEQTFPDHHFYTQNDINGIEKNAIAKGAKMLLTTAKDAVKLKDLKFNLPCLVVESEMIFGDESGLRKLIIARVKLNRHYRK